MTARLPDSSPLWIEEDRDYVTPCWVWQRCINKTTGYGYWRRDARGRATRSVRPTTAHRAMWIAAGRVIPAGMHLDHLCRVRSCVRLDHLEPVTPAENVRRSANYAGYRTHCPRGHAYSAENTYRQPDGGRRCRECARARKRAHTDPISQ